MTVVKILAVVFGAAFLLFGYFIYFRRKFHLINDFQSDFRAGRKNEKDAERIGLIEFILGIVLLAAGILLILFT